jgi:hypothetical protein
LANEIGLTRRAGNEGEVAERINKLVSLAAAPDSDEV